MARRVNRNLIALGSAAIVGVYALGYARTQPSAGHVAAAVGAAPSAAAANVPQNSNSASGATSIARAIAAATASPAVGQASASGATTSAAYRDGTYSGSGTSRRGDIYAELTIQGGKITAVHITRATTYYPTSRISQLPGQVITRQSAQVDYISGATDSSRAFRQAVAAALGQASSGASAAVPAGA